MSSSLQIVAGKNSDDTDAVQVQRLDDGEMTVLFTCPVKQAYQFFTEGVQVCLIIDPTLDEIPDDLRG